MTNVNVEQLIEHARFSLVQPPSNNEKNKSWIFFSSLVLGLDPIDATGKMPQNVPVASDGKAIYYDRNVIAERFGTLDDVRMLLCHEVMHCAFGHIGRGKDVDSNKFLLAADAIVNAILTENGITIHDGITSNQQGIIMNWDGKESLLPFDPPLKKLVVEHTVEELYSHISDPPSPPQPQCGVNAPNDQNGDGDQDQDDGSGQNDQDGDGEGDKGGQRPSFKPMSDTDRQIWGYKMRAAYEQAKQAGYAPGGIEEILNDLYKPEVDWRRELASCIQIVHEDETFMPPSRHCYAMQEILGEEIILPGPNEGEIIADIVFAIDTSGSVSNDELKHFCSEVYGIAQIGVNLHLVYCDAQVNYWGELTADPPPHPIGRGGTRFEPVFEEVAKHKDLQVEALVYFTDGEAYFPDEPPPYPVIWVINNTHQTPPWGRVIRYKPSNEMI